MGIIFVDGSTLTRFGIVGTNYCGPGYSDGKLLAPGEEAKMDKEPTSAVDGSCKMHDVAYDTAQGTTDI